MQIPNVDANGSFEKILQSIPKDWPWALPHYFAVNVVSGPKTAVVGWTASPDGENQPHTAFVPDHSKLEIIGFWKNTYKVVSVKGYLSHSDAEREAKNFFAAFPTKYLMYNGQIISKNQSFLLTGNWPSNWEFTQIRDLGVFFCYLVILAQSQGETGRAEKVKESLSPAWPQTELILSYQNAFQVAQKEFGQILDVHEKMLIEKALKTIKNWLKQ